MRELPDRAQRFKKLRLLRLHRGIGRRIMLMVLNGLELAKLRRQFLILLRLPRLPPQTRKLRADLPDHILEPFEIGFGGLEAQLCLMAAAVEPRDARRIFQDSAALLRLRADELADCSLLDERLASRAGCGIGEEDLHVLGAHLLAVDLVDGASLPLNAPGDFQHVSVVERSRSRALRIVDGDHHLGHVAGRPPVGARENRRRPWPTRACSCRTFRPSPSGALRGGSIFRSHWGRRRP